MLRHLALSIVNNDISYKMNIIATLTMAEKRGIATLKPDTIEKLENEVACLEIELKRIKSLPCEDLRALLKANLV